MRVQLEADTDKKLNDAIKAEPKMLNELQDKYKLTNRSVEALVEVLSTKYREIIAS